LLEGNGAVAIGKGNGDVCPVEPFLNSIATLEGFPHFTDGATDGLRG